MKQMIIHGGKAGYVHAYLQAYWFRFLVDAKIMEQEIKSKQQNKK